MHFEHQADPTVIYFTYHPDLGEAGGYYDADWRDNVYLNERAGLLEREANYWHESKHRECCKTGCFCWGQTSPYWAEYHAFKYELERVVAHSSIRLKRVFWATLAQSIKRYSANKRVYPTHVAVLRRLTNTKLFREFADSIYESVEDLWIG